MDLDSSLNRLQDTCPSCGAGFAPALGGRVRKVQCPKCREVILRGPPGTAKPETAGRDSTMAALQARVERLEAVESRVELLEKQLEWLMDHRPPAEASLLRPGQRLRWLRAGANGTAVSDENAQREILLHNLRALRGGAISIQCAGDAVGAHEFADQLSSVFQQAAWRVDGPHPRTLSRSRRGLVLLGSTSPASPSLTAASMALSAAGFAVECGFDDALPAEQTILLVAPPL